jgi:type IV pilus assembly protein PilB
VARKQLGSLLVEAGVVTREQVEAALAEQKRSGGKLGELLVGLGYTTAAAVSEALANQLREESGDVAQIEPEPGALARIGRELALRHKAVALELREDDGLLLVAMANPSDLLAIDALELEAKLFVQPVQLTPAEIDALLARWYPASDAGERRATRKRRVGEILIEAGIVDESQVAIALAEQKRTGGQLGQILVNLGLASEEAVSHALADQTGVEHLNLDAIEPDPVAIALVSEALAREHRVAPLRADVPNGTLTVAMANPADIVAIDELEMATNLFVEAAKASERQVSRYLDRAYARKRSQGEVDDRSFEALIKQAVAELEKGDDTPTRGGIAALVDELIAAGVRREATDVHVEPDRNVMRVRYRVDGDLVQGPTLSQALLPSIVARIKILAQLDIAVTRTPQDGKISFPFANRRVDLRVSTFPTISGESVVVRVLDTSKAQFTLDRLGLSEAEQKRLRGAIQRPNGLILAVGPTGSGKTTTLYALLRAANSTARKIITLEDPVEYELSLVTQCQVNEKAGLTFASGLRAILRHDPDIVLVGEMRDTETCQMAMRASLTGHLVLSTLHTNDAVRTVSRLRDMGMESYLIASCLSVVCAQRLVRLICESCRQPYAPEGAELEVAGLEPADPGPFSRGAGCERCSGTGMRGRKALYEVLHVGGEISQLIARDASVDQLVSAAERAGMVNFRTNATRLAREGAITLTEAARVAMES